MNSRIRERGYTAKEMAWNRDQISNKFKPISDPSISKHQVELRKARHPQVPQLEYNFKVGDNVFLKKDLSKLRGREMYKIISFFQRESDGGKMAIIRKCENKFMSKDYEVTLAEMKLAIPNMVPVFDDKQHDESISQKELETTNNENAEDEVFDSKQTIPHNTSDEDEESRTTKDSVTKNGRTKRKSALKQRQLMENLVDSSLLQVSLVEKAPTHPFNYEDWIKLLDDDVDVRRPKINMRKMKPETHDVDDYNNADLNWDHSP